jgi:hypothetical protein
MRWHVLLFALALLGFAPPAQAAVDPDPATLTFTQDVSDGPSAPQTSTVTNNTALPVAVTSVSTPSNGFELLTDQTSDCSPTDTLLVGEHCDVRVRFDPSSTGPASSSVVVTTDGGSATVTLSGAGTFRAVSSSESALAFGSQNISVGPTASRSFMVTNTGTGAVTLGAIAVGGTDMNEFLLAPQPGDCASGTTLQPGDACRVHVTFDPSSVGSKSANVTVQSNAPTVQVDLTGTGTAPALSRDTDLSFTRDVDDGPTTKESIVTNTGNEPVPIHSVGIGGPDGADFTRLSGQASDCMTQTLAVGASCKVRMSFDPTTTGTKIAFVTIDSSAPDLTIGLSGTATQTAAVLSPTTLSFADREVGAGASAPQSATLSNTGTEPVTVSSIGTTGNAGDFNRVGGQAGDCADTTTLSAGAGCTLRYAFDPTSTGTRSATVSVNSNAGTVTLTLSGKGLQTTLERSPASLDFGRKDVDDGQTDYQTATVTNPGSDPVTVTRVATAGPDAEAFPIVSGGDCSSGAAIPGGGSCTARVAFDPSTTAEKSGQLVVSASGASVAIDLSGFGTQTSIQIPPTLDLGVLEVGAGKTALKASTVANTGTEPVTLASIRLRDPDTARFLWAGGLSGDCAAGQTLAAGQSCALRVVYAPQSDGLKTGTLTVNSTAGSKTLLVTAAATPGLRIPAFSVRASRVQNRRLTVIVNPIGGTVSNIVVRIRSSSGAVVGSGTLTRASSERGVSVRLRSTLRPGRYFASASGRDLFAGIVTAPARKFSVR